MKRMHQQDLFSGFISATMAKADILLEKFQSQLKGVTSLPDTGSLLPFIQQLYTLSSSHPDGNFSEKQVKKYFCDIGGCFAQKTSLLEDLCRLCVKIFKAHADDCFVPSSEEQQANFGQQFEVLNHLLKIFHNFTDGSLEFCLALSRIDLLYRECASPLLTSWVSRHALVSQGRLLVNSVLGFVGNQFFKNNTEVYDNLSALELVEPVMPYLSSPVLNIKVLALFLIAFALDESQAELYESATEVMQFMVDSLKEATTAANRTCYVSLQDADYQTYHAIELAQCINRLALNEVNKKLLVGFGLLPVLRTMCDSEAEDEVAAALDILFTLSFREGNCEAIKQQFSDILQRLYSSSQPARHTGRLWRSYRPMQGLDLNLGSFISGLCSAAVDSTASSGKTVEQKQKKLIKERKQEQKSKNKESESPHVMISYQHENKELALRIKEALGHNGIQVWIDYEQMQGSEGGSTLSLMADGVEGCFAFLMCMSRTYKDSNNCRLEAEYAYKKQKMIVPLLMEHRYRPSGWLGIMLGMGMYRDFSGKYPFDVKLAELLDVLQKAKLGEPIQEEVVGTEKPQRSGPVESSSIGREGDLSRPVSGASREHHFPSAYQALPPINSGASQVRGWTVEQTVRWLTERADLPETALAPSISGADLHFLVTARDRDPRTFYRLAERYLTQPGSVQNLARFVNALYEL